MPKHPIFTMKFSKVYPMDEVWQVKLGQRDFLLD